MSTPTLSEAGTAHRLLLACFPKSGSTFLAAILSNLPGFRKVPLVPAYGRREQELDMICLDAAQRAGGHYVAQHHVRYSEETRRLIDLCSLHPIVLVRNIYDVVASVRDHLKTRGTIIAQAYVPSDLPLWPDPAIEQFIAELIVPWYFNFYASWSQCPTRIELTYETLVAEPFSVVRHLCDRTSISATDAQLRTALATAGANPQSTRFNAGICGRGQHINPAATAHIAKLALYYDFLNLSALGL